MEKQLYVCNGLVSAARRIRVRDNGICFTETASIPPSQSRLTFIGTSATIAGFLDRDASAFILWDVDTSTEVRRVLFDPRDTHLTDSTTCCCGLGHNDQGVIKIVGLGRIGMRCRIKINSSGVGDGAITGGSTLPNSKFQEDQTWAHWADIEQGMATFLPDQHQPARLVGPSIYWFGKAGRLYRIITLNVNTEEVATIIPPVNHEAIALGYGFTGVLTASLFQGNTVTIWGRVNQHWEHVIHIELASVALNPATYPYVPLFFFFGPHRLLRVFLVDEDTLTIIRSVEDEEGQWASEPAEEIYWDSATLTVSLLPTTQYQIASSTMDEEEEDGSFEQGDSFSDVGSSSSDGDDMDVGSSSSDGDDTFEEQNSNIASSCYGHSTAEKELETVTSAVSRGFSEIEKEHEETVPLNKAPYEVRS